jgi:hypothetical protein
MKTVRPTFSPVYFAVGAGVGFLVALFLIVSLGGSLGVALLAAAASALVFGGLGVLLKEEFLEFFSGWGW